MYLFCYVIMNANRSVALCVSSVVLRVIHCYTEFTENSQRTTGKNIFIKELNWITEKISGCPKAENRSYSAS